MKRILTVAHISLKSAWQAVSLSALTALFLLPLAGTAAAMDRIAIHEGRFVDAATGKPFRPFGVNYYRGGETGG
jgi:hypothetical protein